jgi:hypothetical protein
MKLITHFELAQRSDRELAALFASVACALPRTTPGSPERRNALASMENIRRERAARLARPRP